jgi:tetratricopeptide (TPR) repeat protein
VHVWLALADGVANCRCRCEDWVHASEQALHHARLAAQRRSSLFGLESALVAGPRPADEALRTLDAFLPENPQPWTLLRRAELLTMLARFKEASQIAREASERSRELTGDSSADHLLGSIAATAGDHENAAVHLRRACDLLETLGHRSLLSTAAPMLGRSLCALGRHDEAEPLAHLGRELGDEEDAATQTLWRQVQALVHAHHEEHAEAEQLAREAVAITERTDGLNMQGDALCDLAEVLHAVGRRSEAATTLGHALDRYERKRNLVMARRARERLGELQPA